MYYYYIFLCFLYISLSNGEVIRLYPSQIDDINGVHSTTQSLHSLSLLDQSSTGYDYSKGVVFQSFDSPYSGIFIFDCPEIIDPSSIKLTFNFMGEVFDQQGFLFEICLSPFGEECKDWRYIGDTKNASSESWTLLSFSIDNTPESDLSMVSGHSGRILLRFISLHKESSCFLDFVQLSIVNNYSFDYPHQVNARNEVVDEERLSWSTASHPRATSANVQLKFLVLYKGSSPRLNWTMSTFDSVGMPYSIVAVTSSTDLQYYFTESNKQKYAGIVLIGPKILSSAQLELVYSYQRNYGVKLVVLGSDPKNIAGMKRSSKGVTDASGLLSVSPSFSKFSHTLASGLSVPSSGSVIPAVITDSNTVTPALLITMGSETFVASAVVSNPTLQMHYFIDQSFKYRHSKAFAAVLLNWLSPGSIFQGTRRIYVCPQADDLFMPSSIWDIDTQSNPESNTYRITASDLQCLADHIKSINEQLPRGSNVTVEFPFNGYGVEEAGGYHSDPLFKKAQELQKTFFYLSHTFKHPCTLDTANYDLAYSELSNTEKLFSDGTKSSHYSPTSLVNPCITGLFNGNVLRAMKANGIRYAVGDNSVTKLVPDNYYHIINTTTATHGEAGIIIIPRFVTNIYYDVSTPDEEEDEYNFRVTEDGPKSYQQIMDKEVYTAVEHLLVYRQDPTMFHQANARAFEYDRRTVSHIGLWLEGVSVGISQFYSLPVHTVKQDDLAKIWLQRYSMDVAGFSATLQVMDGKIVGVWTTSNYDCVGAITGFELSPHETIMREEYGTEITYYVSQTGGSTQYYSLSSPVPM